MTKIYLIRHAEAEGNVFRRGHGHYNSFITAKGHRQIAALAERFRELPVDAVVSSDLRRAMTTAGAITKFHNIEISTDARLREMALGEWEDEPWGNLEFQNPQNMWNFNNDPASWNVAGGEKFCDLQERMLLAVSEIAEAHSGKTIVIVSHGMAIRSLLCRLRGISSAEIGSLAHGDNTCVSLLEHDGKTIQIKYINDNSHLPGDLSTFARQAWWHEENEDSTDIGNLRLEPLNPRAEPAFYTHCYAAAWQHIHKTREGFCADAYLDDACRHHLENGLSLMKAIKGERAVGIIHLDTIRGKSEAYGWISLIFVEERERRTQLGVQLLGHAVALFRSLGAKSIRLNVAKANEAAIKFYEEYEFKVIGEERGAFGTLLLMEREI